MFSFPRTTALIVCLMGSTAQAFCFAEAAQRYSVSEPLLRAIAQQESSMNPSAVHHNIKKPGKAQTRDIGLMQINSDHLPKLARYGIHEKDLFEPCTNVHIGAWVLAGAFKKYGPTWRAVGAYNAGFLPNAELTRSLYAQQIARRLGKIPSPQKSKVATKRNDRLKTSQQVYAMKVIE